jgi:molybdopterin synthase catalytic subunit
MMATEIRLLAAAFSPASLLQEFVDGAGGAGAIVSFCGIARGQDRDGDSVTSLRLDHHPRMTATSLERIGRDAASRFGVDHCLVVHRYGSIAPSEPIVFVAAAARHRRAAFLAVDYLMDRLKSEAVFWKREEGPEGGRWIEPTEVDRADLLRWEE